MKKVRAKKKMQFSKLHVIFADFIVFYVYTLSAVLAYCGREPVSDIAISIVTVYGAFATGGYFAQNCIRDTSLNKHGMCRKEEYTDEND
jgi:Kef-type K+ transport system membrane component KefB